MSSDNLQAKKEYLEVIRETLELIDEPNADTEVKINTLRRAIDGLITIEELSLEPYQILQEQVNNLTDLVLNMNNSQQ